MKILSLKIRNYRTLESVDLSFPSSYAAICGPNDSGKTNVVRALRALVQEDTSPFDGYPGNDEDVSLKDDYPKWKDTEPTEREIVLDLTLALHRERDVGLYQLVTKQLALQQEEEVLHIEIEVRYKADRNEPSVVVRVGGTEYTDLNAQQVLKKVQSSRSILFHNSTQLAPRYFISGDSAAGFVREISGQHDALIASMKKTVNRGLSKISKRQQVEFESLLGRLQTKYKVGLSMPAFDFGFMPFRITLGEKKYEVPLDDWGSGTRNRTLILMTLFRARQIGEGEASASKITPVIVVEEPESFLHPSAQAEFGRVLQDLAEEFQVQVLVTTHSPYLLSMKDPGANILLRRKLAYRQLRDTERVETASDCWMTPFGEALGLEAEELRPWRSLILSSSDAVLLVEGDTDREYFDFLRDDAHGAHRLAFRGEIIAYDGTGALHNAILLKFIKNRCRKLFVTFDLDAVESLERLLAGLGLERGRHYLPVGLNAAGKRNIEGLLPERVVTAVYGANASLVQAATHGSKAEQESAKNRLKRLLLDEFRRVARPGEEDFGHFYSVARTVNKALL